MASLPFSFQTYNNTRQVNVTYLVRCSSILHLCVLPSEPALYPLLATNNIRHFLLLKTDRNFLVV